MMKSIFFQPWPYVLLFTLVCHEAIADGDFLDYVSEIHDSTRSSLWLEYQKSEDDSTDFYMEMGLYLSPSNKLAIGLGKSQLEAVTENIETSNYSVQFTHYTKNDVDIGLGYFYWGNSDELWTETATLLLAFHTENFSFRLQPRFSTLDIYTVPIMGQRKLVNSDSKGLESSISFYGFANWAVSINASSYDYDADLTQLNSRLGLIVFSNSTLLLSDNFLEKSYGLEIKRQFENADIGLVYQHSVSAIDHSDITSHAINLEWFFHTDYSLFIEAGETMPELGNNAGYLTSGLSILF